MRCNEYSEINDIPECCPSCHEYEPKYEGEMTVCCFLKEWLDRTGVSDWLESGQLAFRARKKWDGYRSSDPIFTTLREPKEGPRKD